MFERFKAWLIGHLTATKSVAAPVHPTGATGQVGHKDVQNLVPYAKNQLERSRTQWQFCDWERLAATGMPPPALAGARMGIATYTVEPLQS